MLRGTLVKFKASNIEGKLPSFCLFRENTCFCYDVIPGKFIQQF